MKGPWDYVEQITLKEDNALGYPTVFALYQKQRMSPAMREAVLGNPANVFRIMAGRRERFKEEQAREPKPTVILRPFGSKDGKPAAELEYKFVIALKEPT